MTIRDIALLIRRLWWVIAAGIVAGLIVSSAAAAISVPQYQSTAHVLVSTPDIDTQSLVPPEGIGINQRASNYAAMATSNTVARKVIDKLHLATDPGLLLTKVSVDVEINSTILRVAVVDPDPHHAQQLTKAFVTELIASVPKIETASGPVQPLTVTDAANLPQLPHSAGTASVIGLGVLVGGVVGIAVVWILQFLDGSVRRVDDLAAITGAPVLTVLDRPRKDGKRSSAIPVVDQDAEPFFAAHAPLRVATVRASHPIVAVTGVGAGAAHVAVNLAASYASVGSKVLLIAADPAAAKMADTDGVDGHATAFDDVLAGTRSLPEAVIPWRSVGADVLMPSTKERTSARASGWEDMTPLLDQAREPYDLVILSCAPLLTSSGSGLAVAAADATVLVARWGSTRRTALAIARDRLQTVDGHLAGTVLTNVPHYASTATRGYAARPYAER